ncbi:unnamed protein product, partial [Ixodes hexagonus]
YSPLWRCAGVPFVTRDQWGANPSKNVEYHNVPNGVAYVFYHHTEGDECFSFSTCAAIIRMWQRFHQFYRGWDDISYSFLIGGDGRVYEGRGWDRIGAHTLGYNNQSLAFAFIGDFSNHIPNRRMLIAAQRLIGCGIALGKIRPDYTLHGHRDANCRQCPGDAFYAFMRTCLPHFGGRLQRYVC